MTLPTPPHAIFSTLQGTQNPDTKPTLQRAKKSQHTTHPAQRQNFPIIGIVLKAIVSFLTDIKANLKGKE